jgi:hypothetical protein
MDGTIVGADHSSVSADEIQRTGESGAYVRLVRGYSRVLVVEEMVRRPPAARLLLLLLLLLRAKRQVEEAASLFISMAPLCVLSSFICEGREREGRCEICAV